MPRILIESPLVRHRPGDHRLILGAAGFDLVIPEATGTLPPDQLMSLLAEVDAVVYSVGDFTAAMFAALPRLRVVARTGVGFDRIDLAAATRHGVAVTITPGANHDGVAEHTFALILALSRDVVRHDAHLRAGRWDRTPLPRPLRGRTLGIVGLGRIGRAVAERALAFGMRVIAAAPRPHPCPGVAFVPLADLLAEADVVSLHCPLTPETQGMIDRAALSRMKAGALLINTSRGGLVVEADLADALAAGRIAGAGLDTFDPEPPQPGNRLLNLPNVLGSPHMAGVDAEAVDEMARQAAQNVVDLAQGRWPTDAVVNPEVRALWRWEQL